MDMTIEEMKKYFSKKKAFPIGTTVKISLDSVDHLGIVVNKDQIVHNSKKAGGVISSTFEEFSGGDIEGIEECPNITSENLPAAAFKAIINIGQPYKVITSNCEHFVRMAHGMEQVTPQGRRAGIRAIAKVAKLLTNDPKLKSICDGIDLGAEITERGEDPTINAALGGLINYLENELSENEDK